MCMKLNANLMVWKVYITNSILGWSRSSKRIYTIRNKIVIIILGWSRSTDGSARWTEVLSVSIHPDARGMGRSVGDAVKQTEDRNRSMWSSRHTASPPLWTTLLHHPLKKKTGSTPPVHPISPFLAPSPASCRIPGRAQPGSLRHTPLAVPIQRRRPINFSMSIHTCTNSCHASCCFYFGETLLIIPPICVYLNHWNSLD
jgi:hypothetical protein